MFIFVQTAFHIHRGLVGDLKQVGDCMRLYKPLLSTNELDMLLVTSILKSPKIRQFFIEFDKESDIFFSWSIKYTSFWEGGL